MCCEAELPARQSEADRNRSSRFRAEAALTALTALTAGPLVPISAGIADTRRPGATSYRISEEAGDRGGRGRGLCDGI